MADAETGPGVLSTEHVGSLTIANTTLITTRYAMAYAAAVNDSSPAYYDDLAAGGVQVHPGIAFALQWASRFRPDQPANPRAAPYGVHASTDLRLHRPFRVGEAVTTQGATIQLRQITPGVYNVDRYRMTSSSGELIADLYYNGITRGATLAGGDAVLDAEPAWPEVPGSSDAALLREPGRELWRELGRALWREEVPIGLHAAQQYTECAQIYNPIHTEPSVAKAAGLPGIILHGSATKAMSLSVVIERCFDGDATRITRLCGQLRAMVLLGTTIAVEALAEEVVDGEKRVLFRTLTEDGQPAIRNGIVCGRA